MKKHLLPLLLLAAAIASCNSGPDPSERGGIRLGDSSLIISEEDTLTLRDKVAEMEPRQDTAAAVAKTDTALARPAGMLPSGPAVAAPDDKVFMVDFGDFTVSIPKIEAGGFEQNIAGNSLQTFDLVDGPVEDITLVPSGNLVQQVTQQYIASPIVTIEDDPIEIPGFEYTSPTASLRKNGLGYKASSLRAFRHQEPALSRLQTAALKVLDRQKLSARKKSQYRDAIRSARRSNAAPLGFAVKQVIWVLSGKDKRGKKFEKELKMDLPFD